MYQTNVIFRNFKKKTPTVDRGEGIYLIDKEGKKYIDGAGSSCVMHIGHDCEEVIEAMIQQAKKVCFAHTDHFTSDVQEELATYIGHWTPEGLTKVFFTLGGAESNEMAIRLARQYHIETGNPSKYKVISRWHSYHGATLGALSITGRTAWLKNWTPLLLNFPHIQPPYCYRCPFGKEQNSCDVECAYELERVLKLEGSQDISAFIAEPISGSSLAAVVPHQKYFNIIRSTCDKYNILLISEEVMTGFGRTGMNFGIDHWGVIPDIITTAKGISSGYAPLGATICHEKIYNAILNGSGKFIPGITFAGSPSTCAAGLANLKYIEKHNLVDQSRQMGKYLKTKLGDLRDSPIVGDIRGEGLFMGIEFVEDKQTKRPFPNQSNFARRIADAAFEKGLIVLPGSGGVDGILGDHILLAPPFIIEKSEIDSMVEILADVIRGIK